MTRFVRLWDSFFVEIVKTDDFLFSRRRRRRAGTSDFVAHNIQVSFSLLDSSSRVISDLSSSSSVPQLLNRAREQVAS